jgi:hypothetical protein
MKKLYLAGRAVLGLAFVLSFASCSTTNTARFTTPIDDAPRFVDEGSVNAVLQFASWDYTFLVRPQYTVGGYLQQVHRDDIGRVLNKLNVQRGTAVVVVGWTYTGPMLDHVVSDWKTILGGCGFRRVVVLRAQLGNKLNGSVIVDDSNLHVGSLQGASRGG